MGRFSDLIRIVLSKTPIFIFLTGIRKVKLNKRDKMKWLQKILPLFMQRGLDGSERKGMIEGVFHTFFIQGISISLVFLGNLLLARWAGADAYGAYVHIFNWISILSVAAIGGREDLVITEITKYKINDQPGSIPFFVRATNRYIFIASLLISVLFLASIFLFPIRTLHEHRTEFLIASVAVYFTAFLTLNQFILQSLNHIRQSQLVEKLVKPFLLILFFIIARKLMFQLDSTLLIIIADLVMGGCCILLAALVIRATKEFKSSIKKAPRKENHTKKTFYFFCITLLTLLVTKISMLILPYFAPQKDIGFFNISYRFADLIVYPFFLMHTVLPQLFARHAGSEASHNQALYSESTRLIMIFSLPLLALNIIAGKFFLGWFGAAFTEGYTALVLLSIAQFLFSLFGPANTILMMQNREKYSVICLIVYVITLFLTSLLLMPTLGITGGAISMLFSCLVYNILLSVQAYRLSGVISPFFVFIKPLRR